jgi:hypothetical protein
MSQLFDSDEWNNLARRVMIKDLRCGISEKTLNKVLGKTEYKIPVFTCQLAQDSTDQPKKLKGIKRLEVKLDGVRVLAVVDATVMSPCSVAMAKSLKTFHRLQTPSKMPASTFNGVAAQVVALC